MTLWVNQPFRVLVKRANEFILHEELSWDDFLSHGPDLFWNLQPVTYLDCELSMADITAWYKSVLARATKILAEDLLLGGRFGDMDVGRLQDNKANATPGYWFGVDDRNRLESGHLQLHFAASVRVKERFRGEGGQVYRAEAASAYEASVQQFLGQLAVLAQLCAPPLRPRELFSITWKNGDSGRHVYIGHGRAMLYTTYHKVQTRCGQGRESVRFLRIATAGGIFGASAAVPGGAGRGGVAAAPVRND